MLKTDDLPKKAVFCRCWRSEKVSRVGHCVSSSVVVVVCVSSSVVVVVCVCGGGGHGEHDGTMCVVVEVGEGGEPTPSMQL